MRMMKRLAALAVSAVMLVGISGPAAAAGLGSSPVYTATGDIGSKWKEMGGKDSGPGAVKGKKVCKDAGCYQKFADGYMFSHSGDAYWVPSEMRTVWKKHGFENGKYGWPVSDPKTTGTGTWSQKFQNGTLTSGKITSGLPHGVKNKGSAQILIADSSKRATSYGTLERWELNTKGVWKKKATIEARYGYNGLTPSKREGDGKTPMGYFDVPFAFGTKAKPSSTDIEYRKVDSNDQWCSKSGSKHYNTWMDKPNSSCKAGDSEVLSKYTPQYHYSTVIDYNPKGKANLGSAIFLHVNGKGSTAGCVSINATSMKKLIQWIDEDKNPKIVIAPTSELSKQ